MQSESLMIGYEIYLTPKTISQAQNTKGKLFTVILSLSSLMLKKTTMHKELLQLMRMVKQNLKNTENKYYTSFQNLTVRFLRNKL